MPDSETMRSRALDGIKRHRENPELVGSCIRCGLDEDWPCPDNVANTRNLHDLNNADREDDAGTPSDRGNFAVVHDPLGGDHAE